MKLQSTNKEETGVWVKTLTAEGWQRRQKARKNQFVASKPTVKPPKEVVKTTTKPSAKTTVRASSKKLIVATKAKKATKKAKQKAK